MDCYWGGGTVPNAHTKTGGTHNMATRPCPPPRVVHSRKLTWKPKKGPIKTTVPLKGDYMGFHVSLGECNWLFVPPTPRLRLP